MGPVLAFSIPRRGSRNGSSREPVESIGNLQDCFPRAGIGQLPYHLPRLLGTIQPFQAFIRDRHNRVLPSLLTSGPLAARPSLPTGLPYRNQAAASAEAACQIPAQSPSEKSKAARSPAPGMSFVTPAAGFDRD
jgi:hypothetical protein